MSRFFLQRDVNFYINVIFFLSLKKEKYIDGSSYARNDDENVNDPWGGFKLVFDSVPRVGRELKRRPRD